MRTHWSDILLPPRRIHEQAIQERFMTPTPRETEAIKKIVRQEIQTLETRVKLIENEMSVEARKAK